MENSINARGPMVRVIASDSTWIEGEALRQLEEVAKLPGMVRCVGLPDLHPGKGSPVGAAFLSGRRTVQGNKEGVWAAACPPGARRRFR